MKVNIFVCTFIFDSQCLFMYFRYTLYVIYKIRERKQLTYLNVFSKLSDVEPTGFKVLYEWPVFAQLLSTFNQLQLNHFVIYKIQIIYNKRHRL